MTALVYTLGVVLFLAGVIASIALHEVGHMWPAKKFGVKVTQYFVGFGKTVWSVKRGDTEYGIKAIPLGGFIRMVGMLPPVEGEGDVSRLYSQGFFARLIADARAAEATETQGHARRTPLLPPALVEEGDRDVRGPDDERRARSAPVERRVHGHRHPAGTLTVSQVSDCVIPASEGLRTCRVAPESDPDPVGRTSTRGGLPGRRQDRLPRR